MKSLLKKSFCLLILTGAISFIPSCTKSSNTSVPALSTTAPSAITETTAVSGGDITDDGGADITARGVCWGTAVNPTVSGSHTSDGTGKGTFTSNITGLTTGTTYYIRAYATNSAGTAYGNEMNFTTTSGPLALTTSEITAITSTAASSGGNITSDGGDAVTARGVCWSLTENPTTSGWHTTDGTGSGSFTSSITGLSYSTLYHVRAYATNSTGTVYGNELTFTTAAGPGLNEVWIQGDAFIPATITVAAGTTITWTNKDGIAHTITSSTSLFDSGTIGSNGTYSHQFSTAGSYSYYCQIHTFMTGTVIVQ